VDSFFDATIAFAPEWAFTSFLSLVAAAFCFAVVFVTTSVDFSIDFVALADFAVLAVSETSATRFVVVLPFSLDASP